RLPQNPPCRARSRRRFRHQQTGTIPRNLQQSRRHHRHCRPVHHRPFPLRRRHRHHEHHVRLRRRTHPRNRHPQSHRRQTPHHPRSIPHRSRRHLPAR